MHQAKRQTISSTKCTHLSSRIKAMTKIKSGILLHRTNSYIRFLDLFLDLIWFPSAITCIIAINTGLNWTYYIFFSIFTIWTLQREIFFISLGNMRCPWGSCNWSLSVLGRWQMSNVWVNCYGQPLTQLDVNWYFVLINSDSQMNNFVKTYLGLWQTVANIS